MSRTIKPIIQGTHRYLSRTMLDDYEGERMPRILGKRVAIAEALEDMDETPLFAASVDLDEAYRMDCQHDEDEAAEWEMVLHDWEQVEGMVDDDVDSEHYAGQWLVGDVAEVFPDGGYVIEGANATVSRSIPGKADAYMRVHELARNVGIDTKHLVEALRSHSEFVVNGLSYVAMPVCDEVIDAAEYLVEVYGERTPTAGDAWRSIDVLRSRLWA